VSAPSHISALRSDLDGIILDPVGRGKNRVAPDHDDDGEKEEDVKDFERVRPV
jgi:hypothetical protein